MIYIILISGWIGYTKSITKRKHKGSLGNGRFVIDVMIIFLLEYMIHLVNPNYPHNYFQNEFKEVFIWVIPSIYFLYVIWDILKYFEYRKAKKPSEMIDSSRLIITLKFFLLTFFIGCVYVLLLYYEIINTCTLDDSYLVFIILNVVTTLVYRIIKWGEISPQKGLYKAP